MAHRLLLVVTILASSLLGCTSFSTSSRREPVAPVGDEMTAAPQSPTVTPFSVSTGPDDILLQLDFEPTFSSPESYHPFGRVPRFTLYGNGRLIYVRGETENVQQVMEVRLSSQESDALLQQVRALGFDRLESYTEQCQAIDTEMSECTFDAGYTILRARQPDGGLREVKIYYDYGPAPDVLRAVRSLLNDYDHPNAEPYRPEHATLFLEPITPQGVTAEPWPLEPSLLESPLPDMRQWAVALSGQTLDGFLATVSTNIGYFLIFEHEGQGYAATLVPWLPGADYTEEVEGYRLRGAPTLEDLR